MKSFVSGRVLRHAETGLFLAEPTSSRRRVLAAAGKQALKPDIPVARFGTTAVVP